MKVRVLKNNGNSEYSFHADFKELNDAINYVKGFTDAPPIISRTDYRTSYDFYHFTILVRNK